MSSETGKTQREATCSCRRLRVTVWGEPVRVSICHCYECQLRTGSGFSAQARFPLHLTRVSGESREFHRISDGGEMRRFHFCTSCGSTVYFTAAGEPELMAIPIGAFADRNFPAPTTSVWEEHRHPWALLPPEIDCG